MTVYDMNKIYAKINLLKKVGKGIGILGVI